MTEHNDGPGVDAADEASGDPSAADDMGKTIEAQAEFEELVREKGDWQKAVDAQQRGDKPTEEPKTPSAS